MMTPTMTGTQPALYTSRGKTIRPTGQENEKAFDLLNALDESQRKKAILNYRVGDLVLGPGHNGEVIEHPNENTIVFSGIVLLSSVVPA